MEVEYTNLQNNFQQQSSLSEIAPTEKRKIKACVGCQRSHLSCSEGKKCLFQYLIRI